MRPSRRMRAGRRASPRRPASSTIEPVEALGEGRWLVRPSLAGADARARARAGGPHAAAALRARSGRARRALPDGLRPPAGQRGGADRRPALHARAVGSACARAARSSRSSCASASTRSGPSRPRRSRSMRCTARPTASSPRRARRSLRGRRERAPRRLHRHDVGARRRDRRRSRGARRGADVAPDRAGLSLPRRRRARDELPPAPFHLAGARDGVLRRRGDAPHLRRGDPRALPLLQLRRRELA